MSQVGLIITLLSLDVFTAALCVSVWSLEILSLNIIFFPRVLRKQDYLVHGIRIILILVILSMQCPPHILKILLPRSFST